MGKKEEVVVVIKKLKYMDFFDFVILYFFLNMFEEVMYWLDKVY